MKGTTSNFLSNFNLKDSICCGNIYMLEKAQLIFYCQICKGPNLYAEYDALFQHYVDEHQYKRKFGIFSTPASEDKLVNDDNCNEIDKDEEQQQYESEACENLLQPIEELDVSNVPENDPTKSLSTSDNKPDSVYDKYDELFQHYVKAHQYKQECKVFSAPVSEDDFDNEDKSSEIDKDEEQQQHEFKACENLFQPIEELDVLNIPENDPTVRLNTSDKEPDSLPAVKADTACESDLEFMDLEIIEYAPSESDSVDDEVIKASFNLQQEENKSSGNESDEKQQTAREQPENSTNNEDDVYICKTCGRVYETKSKLNTHYRYHKRMQMNQSFPCNICGKAFNDRGNLSTHCKRHNAEKNVQCPVCPKRFRTQTELKKHSIYHQDIKPHMCSTCGKTYFTSGSLKEHIRTHTNDRRYACGKCGKMFHKSRLVRQHEISHSSERPYKCDQCSAAFKTPCSLATHKKSHANLREYKCKLCSADFNLKVGLLRHLKHVHQIED